MLTIGDKFPLFNLKAVQPLPISKIKGPEDAFIRVENPKGKWLLAFFWPKNFTFVCPTEIKAFGDMQKDLADRDCEIMGFSTDNEFSHFAWRRDNEHLQELTFPMVADIKKDLARDLGVLEPEEEVARRATFLVDPEGIIRYVEVTDMKVGRNTAETLRVLDALQTDELCPCNWKAGDETL
jgi:peroxiredoxin (alkyl hydroperoxide reductase subunit C)